MQAKAWLLDIGMTNMAAGGSREGMHLLDIPVFYVVPRAPHYCNRVVAWQGRLLPVMNLAARIGRDLGETRFMAVVGYQSPQDDEVKYGAVPLVSPPRQILVGDEQACELPEDMADLRSLAMSCFLHEDAPVPILNLQYIFGAQPLAN